MKKKITKLQYDFLKRELDYLEEKGELGDIQADTLIDHYEIGTQLTSQKKENVNFVQILSVIGAILIGLGILSFIASNWSGLSDMTKFFILLFGLILTYVAAWFFEERKPVFSKSLYYIGAFAYGAEIFYIGQLFHLGGALEDALLAWALGVLPLAYYLKDKIIYYFSFVLIYLFIEMRFLLADEGPSYWMVLIIPVLFIFSKYVMKNSPILLIANFVLLYQFIEFKFSFTLLEQDQYPIVFTVLLPILFVIGHKVMKKSVVLFIVNVLLTYQWLIMTLFYFDVQRFFIYIIPFFLIGLIMTHIQIRDYKEVMRGIGIATQFIAGMLLTFESVWLEGYRVVSEPLAFPYWAIFGIAYMIYGFYLVYKEQLIGIVIVSVLIFRFYVDLSLVFLNKSIAFFIGGILLLLLGYWFEKTRRGEKKHDKKTTK